MLYTSLEHYQRFLKIISISIELNESRKLAKKKGSESNKTEKKKKKKERK